MKAAKSNSLPQLALVFAGFAATILLFESEALAIWADRLPVGYGRTAALNVTTSWQKVAQPFGLASVRGQSLAALDRLGWSDDPARLAAANVSPLGGPARSAPCWSAASARLGSPVPPRGAATPVAPGVPLKTALGPLPAPSPGQPRVVALVGDSMMAVGLSNMLLRESAANPNLRVVKAFKSGTGLARPDVFNWIEEYPAMIGGSRPDAIIVAIGANDGQGFVENGKVLPYGSDAWVKVYQQRTAAFLDLLTRNGAHVVWVGLPPMKSGSYNEKTAEINRIAFTVVSQNPLATWWNPQPYLADPSGQYQEFATSSGGNTIRLRAPDGIHLSDEGAALLTPTLFRWLNSVPPEAPAQISKADVPLKPARRPSHPALRR